LASGGDSATIQSGSQHLENKFNGLLSSTSAMAKTGEEKWTRIEEKGERREG
jgi:hypothetical protein